MKLNTISLLFVVAIATNLNAQLTITEVDPSGSDAATPMTDADTEWFEITNCGTDGIDVDGMLWYDDESADPDDAVQIAGLMTIGAGESVVAINLDDQFTFMEATDAFLAEFPGYTGQIGVYIGSGMSSSGDDGAALWVQGTAPEAGDAPVDVLIYPPGPPEGLTYQTNCDGLTPGFFAASPGAVVPEPSGLALLLIGLIGFIRRR